MLSSREGPVIRDGRRAARVFVSDSCALCELRGKADSAADRGLTDVTEPP